MLTHTVVLQPKDHLSLTVEATSQDKLQGTHEIQFLLPDVLLIRVGLLQVHNYSEPNEALYYTLKLRGF